MIFPLAPLHRAKLRFNFKHFASCDAQVLVVDTETRHLPPEKAYQIVEELTRAACRAGIRYIYKKTDPRRRGFL